MKPLWIVTWTGGLLAGEPPQAREFPTRTRAKQWARQAGVASKAKLHRVACYDNGGQTADRYTVVFLDAPGHRPKTFLSLGMSPCPFHPQGFGQHCAAVVGRHFARNPELRTWPEVRQAVETYFRNPAMCKRWFR